MTKAEQVIERAMTFVAVSKALREREQERLTVNSGGVKFRVIRCKRFLGGSRTFPRMLAMLKDIVRDGLTTAHAEEARALLDEIEGREAVAEQLENEARLEAKAA